MRVLPVVDRVKSECPIFGNRVHLVGSIVDALAEEPDELPTAYVAIPTDRGGEESTDQLSTQALFSDVDIIVVAAAPDPSSGDEPLEDAADELLPAIHGWQIGAGWNPALYAEGEPWLLDGGRIAYAYTFTFEQPTRLRETP